MKFSYAIGVDLGTATVLVNVQERGIVLNEPSVVAINAKTGKVLEVGERAKAMLGRTPDSVEAIRPLREGVISDFEATEVLLRTMLDKVCHGFWYKLFKPAVMVCVPSVISAVERRAVVDACRRAGMGKVYLIREPIAAAIGAGIDITGAKGTLIVDIGGGTTDVSVISLCEPVVETTLKIAGDVFDDTVIRYVRKNYNLLIGSKTAEEIKQVIGCAYPRPELLKMTVKGRDLISGMQGEAELDSEEICAALAEPVQEILESVHSVLEKTPPELLADISETGIIFTGGGAMLHGLAKLAGEAFNLPSALAEDPITCVARGTIKALAMPEFTRE